MDKNQFKKDLSTLLDTDAHYTPNSANTTRVLTEGEITTFLDHVYTYMENVGFLVDTAKLAFALIKTKGKYDSCQQQADVIAHLL